MHIRLIVNFVSKYEININCKNMKKILIALILSVVVGFIVSSCRTHKPCDAYSHKTEMKRNNS